MCTVKGSAVVIESGFIAESADGEGHFLLVGQARLWCFVYVLVPTWAQCSNEFYAVRFVSLTPCT